MAPRDMQIGTIKVSGLSTNATEQDIQDFFSFSGEITHVDIHDEDEARVAFVIFRSRDASDTAVLLSGAKILDRIVNVIEVDNHYINHEADEMKRQTKTTNNIGVSNAMTRAQDMVSAMLAEGYDLGKDAMIRAKSFDEKHQISSNGASSASSLDRNLGLIQKFSAGTAILHEQVKTVNEKINISEKMQVAVTAAEQAISDASSALMRNQYIFAGVGWASVAFSKVTETAAEIGQRALGKVHSMQSKQDSEQYIAMVNINSAYSARKNR